MSENIVFRVNEFGYSAEMAEDTGANKVSWRLYTSVYTLLLEPVPRIHFIWIRILDPLLIKKCIWIQIRIRIQVMNISVRFTDFFLSNAEFLNIFIFSLILFLRLDKPFRDQETNFSFFNSSDFGLKG